MTISRFGIGAWAFGTTSVTPSPPASVPSTARSIMFVHTRPGTATATINTPSGWTPIGSAQDGGTGVQGADAGVTQTAAFYRDGTFSGAQTVSITSGNSSGAIIITYDQTLGAWAAPASASGRDDTGGSTAFSAALTSNPGITAGDRLSICTGTGTDLGTGATAQSFSATGLSGGSASGATYGESGTGNDLSADVFDWSGFTGTASANGTVTTTYTGATNTYGPAVVVRLREVAVTTVTRTRAQDVLLQETTERTRAQDVLLQQTTNRSRVQDVLAAIRVERTRDQDVLLEEEAMGATRTRIQDVLLQQEAARSRVQDVLLKVGFSRSRVQDVLLSQQVARTRAQDVLLFQTLNRTRVQDVLLATPPVLRSRVQDVLLAVTSCPPSTGALPDLILSHGQLHLVVDDFFAIQL